jgi:hypothetical protein
MIFTQDEKRCWGIERQQGGQVMAYCTHPDTDLTGEPTLEEILAEPIIRLIMKRDGVDENSMRGQIDLVRASYAVLENVQ